MSDIAMHFERLDERPINYVQVVMHCDDGCDVPNGEYSLAITGFCGALYIDVPGGADDPYLVASCIQNDFDFSKAPKEGEVIFILRESGEWEDVFWHKYYEIERFNVVER